MKLKFIVALLFLASGVAYLAWKQGQGPQQEAKQEQEGEQEVQQKEQEQGIEQEKVLQKDIEVIAENLNIPWEIAFLPGGDLLVTERKGTLVRIGKDRKVYQVSGVKHRGEGGLLGMALHPNFAQNKRIYL
ncbi:MAG: PQQ-dependent sugar dehydrogenase, partial [Candidatus Wildermuthbacteria bacterium]|nr:PQQ-dependent sugar dehydrogenase [Candidatus Wildermuthbacteria bacterium]